MPETPRATFCEKLLSGKAGRPVRAGEWIEVGPDLVLSRTETCELAGQFTAGGGRHLFEPELHVVVLEGELPARDRAAAARRRAVRAFVESQGIEAFFDVGEGIALQVVPEQGFAVPGSLLVATGARVTVCGALGAYATGVGRQAMLSAMTTGRVRLRVPGTLRVDVRRRFGPAVGPADLVAALLAELGPEAARDRALEFRGQAIEALPMDGRLALCAAAADLGAAVAYVPPDATTLAYLNGRARDNFTLVQGDPGAEADDLRRDAGALEPLAWRPGRPPEVVPVEALAGRPVHQVLLGGCGGGRLGDLRTAATVLADRKVAAGTRLLVMPASREVLLAALRDGTAGTLVGAGAVLLPPGCRPCREQGLGLAPGDVMLASGGPAQRLAEDALERGEVWRAGPAVCAAAAATGAFADPRRLLAGGERRRTERA